MKKLNQKKIRWIVKEMDKEERTVYRIAKTQNITPQWTRKIYRTYHETKQYPYPRKPGRKTKTITEEDRTLVLQVKKEHPASGAVTLEKILDEQGIHIGHNHIHRILKEEGLAIDEPNKQKRRKWIRYERRYSNSLWHADWFEEKRDKIILFEDDASRFIIGCGVFYNATSKNSIAILRESIRNYGVPKQLMTDHGTQFTSLPRETCADPQPNVFQETLTSYGIQHIKARVGHPQSNGKVEKAIHTIQTLRSYFPGWEHAVYYYNFKRPHSSLENRCLRTPYQAFLDKTRENKKRAC